MPQKRWLQGNVSSYLVGMSSMDAELAAQGKAGMAVLRPMVNSGIGNHHRRRTASHSRCESEIPNSSIRGTASKSPQLHVAAFNDPFRRLEDVHHLLVSHAERFQLGNVCRIGVAVLGDLEAELDVVGA